MQRTIITIILTLVFTALTSPTVAQTALKGAGVIESTTGGFKFPDGSVQLSASDPLTILPPAWVDSNGEILGNYVNTYEGEILAISFPEPNRHASVTFDRQKMSQYPPAPHNEVIPDGGFILYKVAGCAGTEMWSFAGTGAILDAVLYVTDSNTNSTIDVLSYLECIWGTCSCNELGEPAVPYESVEQLIEFKDFNLHPLPYSMSVNYLQ